MKNGSKKKIAVLGGGTGSLSSIFEITNDPNWTEKYESITVYQMGWRLGGKGASGRRPPYGRIEEHGLHVWLGFYNNSFDVIQRAYAELDRPSGSPLATWEKAFKEHSYIVLAQNYKDSWHPWVFNFPTNDLVPGQGDPLPTLWDFMKMILKWLSEIFKKSDYKSRMKAVSDHQGHHSALDRIRRLFKEILWEGEEIGLGLGEDLIRLLILAFDKLDPDSQNHKSEHHDHLLALLEELSHWLRREMEKIAEHDLHLLRLLIMSDLGTTMVSGMLRDKVLFHPEKLNSLDHLDLREWFTKHGALKVAVDSPILKGLYDLVFGYQNGVSGLENANFAAGTAIRCIFRIAATYKGAVFWKMQAGMGDTIFTPLHKVLEKRGVKFKFFHKVKNLKLASDKKSIASIVVERQANVKTGEDNYDPYVDVQDLACWPSFPNYEQLVEGKELKEDDINLESFYTPWEGVDYELQVGEDFDEVIFGISMGGIPFVCDELIKANADWQNMVDKIKTVRTMAFQVWLNKDLKGLGWEQESPVMDAFIDPLNTWADMSQVIDKEDWPSKDYIKNISYFCGPMEGGIPPRSEADTPEKALKIVEKEGKSYLEDDTKAWWSKVNPQNGVFDKSCLVDSYSRANIDPSERYVLSVKDSTKYRLNGGQSGFSNLYLAGDWTRNGINAGCIEACVMSGRIVSNAMTGRPELKDIDGLGDI